MPLTCEAHPNEDTIEVAAAGTITEAEVRAASAKLASFAESRATINVIEIVGGVSGADPSAVWSGLPATARLGRLAVVSDTGWRSRLSAAETRAFPMDRIDAARLWAHRGS